jgi:hypothetical protein
MTTRFIIQEADGNLYREAALLAAGQNLVAGAVLAKIADDPIKYTQLVPAAEDVSAIAAAVLVYDVDASAADQPCSVIARTLDVKGDGLVWPLDITTPQQASAIAQLAEVGIVVR